MKKKQRLAIDDALNSALKPPPARRSSENLTSLLSQYAPAPTQDDMPLQGIRNKVYPNKVHLKRVSRNKAYLNSPQQYQNLK